MKQPPTDAQKKKLAARLEEMEWDEWLALVRWAAEPILRDDQTFFFELLYSRSLKLPELHGIDTPAKRIDLVMANVGVRLVLTGAE